MSKWRDINTAPKVPGQKLLVFTDEIEFGEYAGPDPTEPDSRETWCDSGKGPTHWMPLPEPPEASK